MNPPGTPAYAGETSEGTAGFPGALCAEPIIVLTLAYSGSEIVSEAFSLLPRVVCTTRTGVLPMCHATAEAWTNVNRRSSPLNPLVVKSIRLLTGVMLSVLAADSGASRWCETVVSGTAPAETFLRLFPGARFICFYRRCDSVISEALRMNPWGLGGTEFWFQSSAPSGNSVATVAGYWVDRVQSLLEFEESHVQSVFRARLEDLQFQNAHVMDEMCKFLGLPPVGEVSPPMARHPRNTDRPAPPMAPPERMPPGIRQRVNELHLRLGYSEI
jgi:protein-tyrosine sulfotransferase